MDLAFAALISFAFIFGVWELLLLVAISIAVMNWQPSLSPELLVFALFPIAAYFTRDIFHLAPAAMNAIAIFIGFSVLAFFSAGSIPLLLAHWKAPAVDIVGGELFGAAVFVPLYRIGRA